MTATFDSTGSFAFPPATAVSVTQVGHENEPVVVIDAASGQATALRHFAANRSRFEPAAACGSAYPGLLGPAPLNYVDALVRFCLPLIAAHFTADVVPQRARGNFSLVTSPATTLSDAQRKPHVDTADRMQFAAVHFLSDDNADGTGFFRHRATGFETIDPSRLASYNEAQDRERPSAGGYLTADDPFYELIAAVPAAADRLVLYRAALLHSGLIGQVPAHAADPLRGRLTGNLFLQCRLAA